MTHHCWVEEDEDCGSQESSWSQNNNVINHAQNGNDRPSSQQAAYSCSLKHSQSIIGTHINELKQIYVHTA